MPRLHGQLHLPRLARSKREWATSPRHYHVRVGWHTARISDNVLDLLTLIDGARTIVELTEALATLQHRRVHPAEIVYLLRHRLVPAGMVSLSPVASASRRPIPAAMAPASPLAATTTVSTVADVATSSAPPSVPLVATVVSPRAATLDPVTQPTQPGWHTWDGADIYPTEPPAVVNAPGDGPAATATVIEASPPADVSTGQPLVLPLVLTPTSAPDSGGDDLRRAPITEHVSIPAAARATPVWQPVWHPSTPVPPTGGQRRTWITTLGTWMAAGLGVVFLLIGLAAALILNVQLPGASEARHNANRPAQVVPTATPPQEHLVPGETAYRVRSGDTIASIARHFSVSPEALLIVNADILPSAAALAPGMRLAVPAIYRPDSSPAAQPRPLYYVVKRGDTLYAIAQTFGTEWTTIAAYNHLADPRTLEIGQGLVIPPSSTPAH